MAAVKGLFAKGLFVEAPNGPEKLNEVEAFPPKENGVACPWLGWLGWLGAVAPGKLWL